MRAELLEAPRKAISVRSSEAGGGRPRRGPILPDDAQVDPPALLRALIPRSRWIAAGPRSARARRWSASSSSGIAASGRSRRRRVSARRPRCWPRGAGRRSSPGSRRPSRRSALFAGRWCCRRAAAAAAYHRLRRGRLPCRAGRARALRLDDGARGVPQGGDRRGRTPFSRARSRACRLSRRSRARPARDYRVR